MKRSPRVLSVVFCLKMKLLVFERPKFEPTSNTRDRHLQEVNKSKMHAATKLMHMISIPNGGEAIPVPRRGNSALHRNLRRLNIRMFALGNVAKIAPRQPKLGALRHGADYDVGIVNHVGLAQRNCFHRNRRRICVNSQC